MKWVRRWLIRLLVMVVLVGAVRHAYVNGMVASAWHSFEQSVMRQALEIAMAEEGDDGQAQLWQEPARWVSGWLWARSSPLDQEALVRYWRLRQLDRRAQASGAPLTAESMAIFEEGAPPLPFLASDRSPLPTIGR
jgi:hypothetical protein